MNIPVERRRREFCCKNRTACWYNARYNKLNFIAMNKYFFYFLICTVFFMSGCSSVNMSQVSVAGLKALQAVTLSDEQIQQYTREFIAQSDKENPIAAADDPYTVRLEKITRSFNNRDGLNIKVYKKDEVNAFATADGSIRVYSGLMDIMSDEEILGVIGHEIGHVKNRDTRDAFKNALLVSALRDGIASTAGKAGQLSASQLGDLGEAFFQSQYSQKQEYAADDYGFEFLKGRGLNPWAMSMALDKLKQLEQQAGGKSNAVNQLFSTHPDIVSRTGRMAERAAKEGFKKPGQGGSLYMVQPASSGGASPKTMAPAGQSGTNNWSF